MHTYHSIGVKVREQPQDSALPFQLVYSTVSLIVPLCIGQASGPSNPGILLSLPPISPRNSIQMCATHLASCRLCRLEVCRKHSTHRAVSPALCLMCRGWVAEVRPPHGRGERTRSV